MIRDPPPPVPACHNCGVIGHRVSECPDRACKWFRKQGHVVTSCPTCPPCARRGKKGHTEHQCRERRWRPRQYQSRYRSFPFGGAGAGAGCGNGSGRGRGVASSVSAAISSSAQQETMVSTGRDCSQDEEGQGDDGSQTHSDSVLGIAVWCLTDTARFDDSAFQGYHEEITRRERYLCIQCIEEQRDGATELARSLCGAFTDDRLSDRISPPGWIMRIVAGNIWAELGRD